MQKLAQWRDEESQYQILYCAAWSIHAKCKGREFDKVVAKLERICVHNDLPIQNMHDAMAKYCEETGIQWTPSGPRAVAAIAMAAGTNIGWLHLHRHRLLRVRSCSLHLHLVSRHHCHRQQVLCHLHRPGLMPNLWSGS